MRHAGKRQRDVSAAEKIQPGLRQNRLDKNLQRAAADQPGIVTGLVVQVERHLARLLAADHFFGSGPHFGFHAAAADCADDRAVLAHQHPRAFKAGNRAVHVDDGRQRPALSRAPHSHDFFEYVHIYPQGTTNAAGVRGRTWGLCLAGLAMFLFGLFTDDRPVLFPYILVYRGRARAIEAVGPIPLRP